LIQNAALQIFDNASDGEKSSHIKDGKKIVTKICKQGGFIKTVVYVTSEESIVYIQLSISFWAF
jgi:hypothetical protein